jgi:hypothetical protein
MCAFIPKCHWLAFLVLCIWGSHSRFSFLVEEGAAIRVASTRVPSRWSRPRAARSALIAAKSPLHRSCGRRNLSSVVASGTPSASSSMRAKRSQRLSVLQRVLERLVGQPIPLLQKIHSQHPLQPHRRPTAFALRIVRRNHRQQSLPRDHLLHARQELLTSCDLLLGGELGLGESRLLRHVSCLSSSRTTGALRTISGED